MRAKTAAESTSKGRVNEQMQHEVKSQRASATGTPADKVNRHYYNAQYSKYRLCNDCVLLYETALKLNKIKNIEEFMEKTEEKRLEALCDFIKKDKQKENN